MKDENETINGIGSFWPLLKEIKIVEKILFDDVINDLKMTIVSWNRLGEVFKFKS